MSNILLKLLLLVLKGMTMTFWTESLVSVLLTAAETRTISKEIYKGEYKAGNNQSKLYFIQNLITLSLSNEMIDRLLCGPIRK